MNNEEMKKNETWEKWKKYVASEKMINEKWKKHVEEYKFILLMEEDELLKEALENMKINLGRVSFFQNSCTHNINAEFGEVRIHITKHQQGNINVHLFNQSTTDKGAIVPKPKADYYLYPNGEERTALYKIIDTFIMENEIKFNVKYN